MAGKQQAKHAETIRQESHRIKESIINLPSLRVYLLRAS
jgi:hypothetical protein